MKIKKRRLKKAGNLFNVAGHHSALGILRKQKNNEFARILTGRVVVTSCQSASIAARIAKIVSIEYDDEYDVDKSDETDVSRLSDTLVFLSHPV